MQGSLENPMNRWPWNFKISRSQTQNHQMPNFPPSFYQPQINFTWMSPRLFHQVPMKKKKSTPDALVFWSVKTTSRPSEVHHSSIRPSLRHLGCQRACDSKDLRWNCHRQRSKTKVPGMYDMYGCGGCHYYTPMAGGDSEKSGEWKTSDLHPS